MSHQESPEWGTQANRPNTRPLTPISPAGALNIIAQGQADLTTVIQIAQRLCKCYVLWRVEAIAGRDLMTHKI
jgi:hypothetical protein